MSPRHLLPVLLLSTAAVAGDAETEQKIRTALHRAMPQAMVEEIRATPVPELYEITVGGSVYYASADGRYLVDGKLYDLETRKNLTEERQVAARKGAIGRVDEGQMIIFEPKQAKHTVTVFTDIDCGYCRKLHGEMADYLAAGIRVRYLFFPRAGVASGSYDKAVSVWCSEDRNQALTLAKQGKEIEKKKCENPIKAQMELGEELGVRGTPSIITESGEFIPGYVPAERLAAALDEAPAAN